MTLYTTLRGTKDEAQELFERFNVRQIEEIGDKKYKVVIRVLETFNGEKVRSIKKMIKELEDQQEHENV